MAILRVRKKQENFVVLDKTCLHDKSLSWGAKGLHAYLISLPDDWVVKVEHLQTCSTNGRDSVRTLLNELSQSGYIIKSSIRKEGSGRFEGLEYLVLEKPEPNAEKDFSPETENPSPVKNADLIDEKSPAPGNPSPDSAAPVNPTLLSINITKDLKTAEEEKGSETEKLNSSKEVAAAVSFSKTQKEALDTLSYSPSDSVIGKDLTSNQLKRVEGIVRELRPGNADTLIQEITFCLLNPNHFTGCGKDFLKKLNTIRSVIRKGDWQRPAGMVIEKKSQVKNELAPLEAELSQAYAEVQHFERLAKKAKPESVSQFKGFVAQAQLKIKKLEGQIEAILEHFKKQDIAVC